MLDTIRSVTDGEQIIKVIHAAFKRYEDDPMPSSALIETASTIKKELESNVLILGTEFLGQIVGVVKVVYHKDYIYFSRLSVLPEYQGRGIASKLVKHIEKLAVNEEIPYVRCKVRKSEEANIRLYRKLGFHISIEEVMTSPLGFVMETLTMEKKVID
ncbi:GNAT family N-acetyltransferase [Solibacillus sp. FSL K6-4121]|uniref:GNAT family N-acetyltransferase n=1 Tax=Solibacillus sp. FSL K6-4121 TaxID=2921505 RepID=UPI0030F8E7E6